VKTVVVIDDNLEIRENTAELLGLNGYNVFTADNGIEGYELIKTMHPQVICCDMAMPGTDVKNFLTLLKNDKTTNSIRLVFFSAGSVPYEVRMGFMQAADKYLPKPFSEYELLSAIEGDEAIA